MRNKHLLAPLLALLAGCGGLVLNHQLQTVGVDSYTLLLVASQPYTTQLLALSAVVVLVLALLCLQGTAPEGLADNFYHPPQLTLILWVGGGVLLSASAGFTLYHCFTQLQLRKDGFAISLPITLFAALALSLPAAVALFTSVKYLSHGECPDSVRAMSSLPAYAVLPWLLYCYQENTRNPVISLYGYQLVGFAVAAVAFYLVAALDYVPQRNLRPKMAALSSLVASYLLLCSLTLEQAIYLSLVQVAFALTLLGHAAVILQNIQPNSPEDTSTGRN